jgi:hypothetical protein
MVRFEELQPGDLFLYIDARQKFYALKTQKPTSGPGTTMVILGPSFLPPDITEAFLLSWDTSVVLSLGKSFSILLATKPAEWSWSGETRTPIYLGVAGETIFICANGGRSSQNYFPCFVDVRHIRIYQSLGNGCA